MPSEQMSCNMGFYYHRFKLEVPLNERSYYYRQLASNSKLTQCRQHRMRKESKTEHNLAYKNSSDGAQQKEAMQHLKY